MRQLLTVAILALVATACLAAAPSESGPVLVAIPTAEPQIGQVACMDALMSGRLVANEETGVAVHVTDRTTIVIVWPHGWVAVDYDGARIVVNERGDPVARVGEMVEIGGGFGGGDRWYTCGEVTHPVP